MCRPVLASVLLAVSVLSSCGPTGSQKLPLFSDCGGENAACASAQCFSVDSATSVCTKSCAGDDECPGEGLCAAVPGVGSICLPTGLGGRCKADAECPVGHRCDLAEKRCYIPVSREPCAPCTSSLQCPADGRCLEVAETLERYCAAPCGAGNTCGDGYTCEERDGVPLCLPANEHRTCSLGKGLCAPCRGDVECGVPGDVCVRNLNSGERFCGRECVTSAECPSGFNCLDLSGEGDGPYQCVPNGGTCVGYCDSADPAQTRLQCGLGRSCDVDARACVPATDGSLCAPCGDDDSCGENSRCLENKCADCPYRGEKFCATPCAGASSNECGVGFFCVGIGAAGAAPFYCAPTAGTCTVGTGRLGDDCTGRGAQSCATGVCLGFGRLSVCSTSCANDGACGDARFRCCGTSGAAGAETFDCNQTPNGNGVCVPRGGGFGADCSPGQPPCFQGACLDMGTAQICSRGCDAQTPCPEGFGCRTARQPAGDGTFTDVNICFPDGGGTLGSDCEFGPAACQSGLCLKKTTGSECTQTCTQEAGCPEGWSCVSDTTVDGQTLEVCLPDELTGN